MYLLKLALRPWRKAFLSQIFSSLSVGLLLLLCGFLVWMENGLQPVIKRLRSEQVITAYLDPAVDSKEETRLVDSIRVTVGAKQIETKLVAPAQFVKEISKQYPLLGSELENLGNEMTQVVPRYISVSGMLSDGALEKVRAIPGIESAESSKDRHRHIIGAFQAVKWVARLFVVGLCFALLTGLLHLSRTNADMHKDALSLLKLWGAGALTIRAPGLISGLWVGLIGGGIAAVGWVFGADWFARQVFALSPMLREMSMPPFQYAFALLGAGCLMGALAGLLGVQRRA